MTKYSKANEDDPERKSASAAARALGKLRWKGRTVEERQAVAELGSSGGTAAWRGMTKAQRSEENKRRAQVRRERKAKED